MFSSKVDEWRTLDFGRLSRVGLKNMKRSCIHWPPLLYLNFKTNYNSLDVSVAFKFEGTLYTLAAFVVFSCRFMLRRLQ